MTDTTLVESDAVALLTHGSLELEGRLLDASNTTLRAVITHEGVTARCVYKPVQGERPLWDFPDGTLAGREVSAYLVSRATGWGLVPPTVLRDGPLGPGACQLWIDEDETAEAPVAFVPAYDVPEGWFPVAAARDDEGDAYSLVHADDPRLARLAVLDAVINNADRKGGHVLVGAGDRLYGVDHGVCFHTEDKLRTVLWGWTGKPLPGWSRPVLAALATDLGGALGDALADHLTLTEIRQIGRRVARLQRSGRFPEPPAGWPAMPWPPI
ncbi:SCO1664 family protein [Spirilliplanes yamanashiensis]|uniref:Phosphatidylinositol kinase n=1 Tax=Spirilliplanes yamanashiensis TaxID=42233 RepID=A0A8J3YAV6_9ACTN|nr:SCO1664 family protein [Spirilliplanes yamanashiensis]MDP9817800.1 putative repeat protein (TIGR03843 family) [Spirilliplanes yamanashiensis]GIJ04610.1 phosphatidylinositol kinase [Spirilliplanes yamanashiensis]